MNRVKKATTSVGAAAIILSGMAMAAAPTGYNDGGAGAGLFDKWEVNAGVINIDLDGADKSCPDGFTCGTAVTGAGFFQRQVTNGAGDSFFQTIITEDGVTAGTGTLDSLPFADESFVQTGNNSGLADKTRISDTDTALVNGLSGSVTFSIQSEIGAGWAATAASGTETNITQSVFDDRDAGTTNDFRSDFFFDQTLKSDSTIIARRMKVSSYVGDDQDFVLIDLSGDYNAGATLDANLSGTNGGTVSWLADAATGDVGQVGENIKAIWIGQTNTAVSDLTFGFTSYDNLTTTTGISEFSLTSTAAIAWDTGIWGANSLLTDGTGF